MNLAHSAGHLCQESHRSERTNQRTDHERWLRVHDRGDDEEWELFREPQPLTWPRKRLETLCIMLANKWLCEIQIQWQLSGVDPNNTFYIENADPINCEFMFICLMIKLKHKKTSLKSFHGVCFCLCTSLSKMHRKRIKGVIKICEKRPGWVRTHAGSCHKLFFKHTFHPEKPFGGLCIFIPIKKNKKGIKTKSKPARQNIDVWRWWHVLDVEENYRCKFVTWLRVSITITTCTWWPLVLQIFFAS